MDRMVFTQAVARLRVLEGKLLTMPKLQRMIDSSNPNEALRILSESEYSEHMNNVKRPEDYEVLLEGELRRVYKLMYEICPIKEIVDIMVIKYDYHNIKVLLKGKAAERDFSNMLLEFGTISSSTLGEAILNSDVKGLPKFIGESILNGEKAFFETKDPQKIDILVDKYMYEDMLDRAKKSKIDFLIDMVETTIDFLNIKTIIRVKKQEKNVTFLKEVLLNGGKIKEDDLKKALDIKIENIPEICSSLKYSEVIKSGIEDYIKNGSLTLFEKLSDDYITAMLKEAKYITFGPEPIVAYINAKETEIKAIRIIMVGKINNISPELIQERLRDMYV